MKRSAFPSIIENYLLYTAPPNSEIFYPFNSSVLFPLILTPTISRQDANKFFFPPQDLV